MIKPMVHRLEAEFWGEIDFVYLDQYDEANRDVLSQYGVRGRPTFILIEPDGTAVTRWFGAISKEEIRAILTEYLVDHS